MVYVRCAWCKKLLDVRNEEPTGELDTSHSICEECASRQFGEQLLKATEQGIDWAIGKEGRK